MSILRSLLPERRALSNLKSLPPGPGEGYGTESGEHVTDRSAMRLAAVYACVELLADNVAALPMDVYRKTEGIRTPLDVTPTLIRQPSNDLTPFEWVQQNVTSLALRGDAFNLVVGRDAMEFATELEPLHPDDVHIKRDVNRRTPIYTVGGERVPTADIVHIRRFTLPGHVTGLSPIGQARLGIGIGLAAEKYGARFFRDSAHPSAVLESDQALTDEQAERNMRAWKQTHGGRRNPAFLSGGLKYRQIMIMPSESQFLEARKFARSEIAMLFRVPPHMIGDTERSTSWGTGIEQQSIGFVRYTLRPWLTAIEQHLTRLLPRGQHARFNAEALLRGDTKSRYESYVQARNAGWMNVNEIRELEDRPPVAEGGDDYLQPLNMGPLGSDPLADRQPNPAPPVEDDDE